MLRLGRICPTSPAPSHVVPQGTVPSPARRTNQDATIGFTPGLAYRPIRAETFWAYFRGMNPLFDDLFEGTGVFLCQETSAKGPQEQVRKFWAELCGGVLRGFELHAWGTGASGCGGGSGAGRGDGEPQPAPPTARWV